MADPLASTIDLGAKLGRSDINDDDPKARQAIQDASAIVRMFTKQTISKVEADSVELRGSWDEQFYLPERPVDVDSVTDVFVRFGSGLTLFPVPFFTVRRDGLLIWPGNYWGGADGKVLLAYTHGYDEVPDAIIAVTLSIAARYYTNPTQVVQESIGQQYSVRYEARGLLTSVGLAGDELKILTDFRNAGR